LAEWLYEDGIGEARAALVDHGRILRARIEIEGAPFRVGAVRDGRLGARRPDGRAAISFDNGATALIDRPPPGVSEGGRVRVEITRAPIAERGRDRPMLVRLAAPDAEPADGPWLRDRIAADGLPVTTLLPHLPDLLEEAGWSEVMAEAQDGESAFAGGRLLVSPTPAMTLIDVDGQLAAAPLAIAGADAAARAIVRLGIGGSIGVDLPTLPDRASRQAAAAAIDAVLPQPFERTAVNGFGFLQIVRRRTRASLLEHVQGDPVGHAARALLRRAARLRGPGTRTIAAHPRVIDRITQAPEWQSRLARIAGAPVALRSIDRIDISAGDVHLAP
jgi:hypothetical protein